MASSDLFQQAVDLIALEQFFEALPLLDQVIEKQPGRAAVYVQRARVRRRIGDKEGAIKDYAQALKLAPTAEIYLARALVWLSLNQTRGAIADSREAVALKPELAGGHKLLGKALGLLGDGPSAIAAYKQAARCYLNNKDKTNAQACLDAIGPLKKLPPFQDTHASGLTQTGNNLTFSPEEATPDNYVQRVQAKYDEGQYAAAIADLNWLLGVEPHHLKALCLRGLSYAQLGKRAQAVADFSLAKQQHPDSRDLRFYRGQMRLILDDGDGAVEEFSALIAEAGEANQPEARYFAQRGQGYRLMGELEKAFKDYANALAIDTENAELYEWRAMIQQDLRETEGAIADYQQAATLWLNAGNWQKHQQIVEAIRALRQQGASPSSTSSTATVAIKSFQNHLPVVEVLIDGVAKFDIVIDRNATHSIITRQMASRLNLAPVSYRYVYLADGTPMELSIGQLRSVTLGTTVITDVYVAIAPDNATPVLGKDCFSRYSVRISGNQIEFHRR